MAKRKTHKTFLNEVYDLVKDEYTILSEYESNKKKVLVKHNKCNHEYLVSPNKFLHLGRRCPKCNGGIKYTDKNFKKKVYDLVQCEYIFLEDYKGSEIHLKCKHNISNCNYEWSITPHHFLAGNRCPKCANNIKKTQEDFVNEVKDKRGTDYKVKGLYKNNMAPIEILHTTCNNS